MTRREAGVGGSSSVACPTCPQAVTYDPFADESRWVLTGFRYLKRLNSCGMRLDRMSSEWFDNRPDAAFIAAARQLVPDDIHD